MRAVQVVSPGDIKIVDVDEQAVSSGFALIKPEMITVCGSDLRQVYTKSAIDNWMKKKLSKRKKRISQSQRRQNRRNISRASRRQNRRG